VKNLANACDGCGMSDYVTQDLKRFRNEEISCENCSADLDLDWKEGEYIIKKKR